MDGFAGSCQCPACAGTAGSAPSGSAGCSSGHRSALETVVPTTHPFRPNVDGVRNYIAWGWTDADLYRAIEADPGCKDEYLQELAQRRIDALKTDALAESYAAEVQAAVTRIAWGRSTDG
jgi:hypothetical protein